MRHWQRPQRTVQGQAGDNSAIIGFYEKLLSVASASATSARVTRVPAHLRQNGYAWAVFDAGTVEAEARKVTLSGDGLSWTGGLSYSHSSGDPILFLDRPRFNALWWGALGDGSTDDYTALSRWLAACAGIDSDTVTAYLPKGNYVTGTGLVVADSSRLVIEGDGSATVLTAGAAITVLRIYSSTSDGARYCQVRDLRIDGDDTATVGLDVELAVHGNFKNLRIENVNGKGLQCDSTQNCTFENIYSSGNVESLYLVNGAAGNNFINCQIRLASTYHAHLDLDSGLSGYSHGVGTNPPNNNHFFGCLFEAGADATYALYIEEGTNNHFHDCGFTPGTTGGVPVRVDAAINTFQNCRFNYTDTAPCFENRGNDNVLVDCRFYGYSGAVELVNTYARIKIIRPYLLDTDGVFTNESGDIWDNLQVEHLRAIGDTADRPAYSNYGGWFFDHTTGKPMWMDHTGAWVDAINGRLALKTPSAKTLDANGEITFGGASNLTVDTAGGAASDNLEAIIGGSVGDMCFLTAVNGARTVVVKHGGTPTSGTAIYLKSGSDYSLDDLTKMVSLQLRAGGWLEL